MISGLLEQALMNTQSHRPMFRHDLTHTGYSTSASHCTNQTLWSYTTGNQVHSSPAIFGGVVFVGSDDNKIYALNASTGAFLWNYTTGNAVGRALPCPEIGLKQFLFASCVLGSVLGFAFLVDFFVVASLLEHVEMYKTE
jgi:hypothetical protein